MVDECMVQPATLCQISVTGVQVGRLSDNSIYTVGTDWKEKENAVNTRNCSCACQLVS